MTTEEWRPVRGWPYEVSNLGRVRRAGRSCRGARVGTIIKPRRHQDRDVDYAQMIDGGRRLAKPVGDLVAEAFGPGALPPSEPRPEHDGDRLRAWRIALGWSHRKAAAELGITVTTLHSYESGRAGVRRCYMLAAEALTARAKQATYEGEH